MNLVLTHRIYMFPQHPKSGLYSSINKAFDIFDKKTKFTFCKFLSLILSKFDFFNRFSASNN